MPAKEMGNIANLDIGLIRRASDAKADYFMACIAHGVKIDPAAAFSRPRCKAANPRKRRYLRNGDAIAVDNSELPPRALDLITGTGVSLFQTVGKAAQAGASGKGGCSQAERCFSSGPDAHGRSMPSMGGARLWSEARNAVFFHSGRPGPVDGYVEEWRTDWKSSIRSA
jgi:hypothetical protein